MSSTAETTSVFVSRIPYDWEEDSLYEPLSREFGKVAHVEFKRDKHNDFRSKGCGVVRFEKPESARKAIEIGKYKLRFWKHNATGTLKIYPLDETVGETSVRTCFAFQRGKCSRGDACEFYHDPSFEKACSKTESKQTKKARKCWIFLRKGSCKDGDQCPFRHCKPREEEEKTHATERGPKVCMRWRSRGRCGKGDNCAFAHPPEVAEKVLAKKKRRRDAANAKRHGEQDGKETKSHSAVEGSTYSIRVRGFPYETTEAEMLRLFKDAGPFDIDFPVFEDSGRSKGFCSFRVASKSDLNLALKLNCTQIGTRWIKVEAGEILRSWHATGKQPKHCKTVFVGNLAYEIDSNTLANTFKECGEIKEIRLRADSAFAFVEFASTRGPAKAAQLHGLEVMGRPMRIDFAAQGSGAATSDAVVKEDVKVAGKGPKLSPPPSSSSSSSPPFPSTTEAKRAARDATASADNDKKKKKRKIKEVSIGDAEVSENKKSKKEKKKKKKKEKKKEKKKKEKKKKEDAKAGAME